MFSKIILSIGLVAVVLVGTSKAILFFPEDESEVKNFTEALPAGYDDPAVINEVKEELPAVKITHMVPLEAKEKVEFGIGATVKNLPRGALLIAHYRLDPLNQYKDVPMKEIAADRYAVTIPSGLMEGKEIQYYLEATFGANRLAHSGELASPHRVALVSSGGVPRFAVIAACAVGGIWLVSKLGSKSGRKKK